jgi:Uma2 family endonuclease
MSGSYQEILAGSLVTRNPPGTRHEIICRRLHDCVRAGVADLASVRLLPPRSEIRLSADTKVCPDLALTATATGKLWLAAEIISSDDHRADTVVKKEIYEELKLPRLWMIDPRYDNVEIYHGTEYGLVLKSMLAGREILSESLLPEFALNISDLFQIPKSQS